MKNIKTFETWNDNIIDNTLFSSGKAKYDPKVVNGKIEYKTGNIEPYYFAEITSKGGKFICKIYKRKKNGEEKRLRNKIKKELKLAHNYVREFLNQKLKKKKKRNRDSEDSERVIRDTPVQSNYNDTPVPMDLPPMPMPSYEPPKSKTIIRRF